MTENNETLETREFTKYDIEYIDQIQSEEFSSKLNEILDEFHGHRYGGSVYRSIIELVNKKERDRSRHERSAQIMMQEAKRMMLTVFTVVDTIQSGSTHRSKNSHTHTALEIIRKQIALFEEFENSAYIESFIERRSTNTMIFHHDIVEEIKDLKNERKKTQQQLKWLKEENEQYIKRINELEPEA